MFAARLDSTLARDTGGGALEARDCIGLALCSIAVDFVRALAARRFSRHQTTSTGAMNARRSVKPSSSGSEKTATTNRAMKRKKKQDKTILMNFKSIRLQKQSNFMVRRLYQSHNS